MSDWKAGILELQRCGICFSSESNQAFREAPCQEGLGPNLAIWQVPRLTVFTRNAQVGLRMEGPEMERCRKLVAC